MPRVQADRLTEIASRLLQAAGASPDEASTVARHCIGANLAGHDSHGIIAIPTYIDRMKVGHIVAGAPVEIVQETPATTVVDGNWGFGFVVSEYVMRTTIEKARRNGVAAATVRRQGHVGRVADYPLMAAQADMIGMMTADSGRSAKSVVPFGGREPRLGTNPICIAMPQRPGRADVRRHGDQCGRGRQADPGGGTGRVDPGGLAAGQRRESIHGPP